MDDFKCSLKFIVRFFFVIAWLIKSHGIECSFVEKSREL